MRKIKNIVFLDEMDGKYHSVSTGAGIVNIQVQHGGVISLHYDDGSMLEHYVCTVSRVSYGPREDS